MAKVELKQEIVKEISDNVKDAASVVLVSSRGLTVAQDTAMRKELREANVTFKVYKNTMMRRAFEGTDFESLNEFLTGPSAIAISKDDVTAPARILNKYVKDIEPLVFKAGVVEGKLCDIDEITALANIPSRDELLSKLLGSIQSPIANFARVIKQIADNGGEAADKPEEAKAEEVKEDKAEEVVEAKAEDAAEAKTEEAAEAKTEEPVEEAKAEEPAEETKAEEETEEKPEEKPAE